MLIHGINRHLYMMPDDDPTGGGGGSPPPPPPPTGDEEMISKKEADKQAANLRRKYDRQLKEQQKVNEELRAEIEKLKNKPAPPAPNPNPNPGANPVVDGKLEIMEAKFTRQIDDLKQQAKNANDLAAAERDKRLKLERQQLIDKALAEAGVVPKHLVQARRFFDPQIIMDEVEERWMFQTQSGNIVEIGEGVAAEMPDNLKSTKMKGGAGTTAGMPAKKKAQHQSLEKAKKKMADLKAQMQKEGPKNHLLAQFSRAKNEVNRLENELAVRN